MTLIDTSAWIEFFRPSGHAEVKLRVARLLDADSAAYCGPVQFELLAGARESEQADIDAALSLSTLLEFPVGCWVTSARIESDLRRKGVTVPRDDVFVAAAAIHHRVPLLAFDQHFAMMKERGELAIAIE